MPNVFGTGRDDDEDSAITAVRSSEESNGNGGTLLTDRSTDELAFALENRLGSGSATTTAADRETVTMSSHSILANSQLTNSSGGRSNSTNSIASMPAVAAAVPATSDTFSPHVDAAPPRSTAIRTSYFTHLAGHLLNRTSSQSTVPMPLSAAPSPDFDKISIDSTPIVSSMNFSADDSIGPSVSSRGQHANNNANNNHANANANFNGANNQQIPRSLVRTRLSSDMSSLQREMENSAFASPISDATYMKMRKTLDPEELLGDQEARHTAIGAAAAAAAHTMATGIRPIADPFRVSLANDFQGFQRGRAATTGTAPTFGVAPTITRSQRSRTVADQQNQQNNQQFNQQPPIGNDPRGTFRTTTADTTQQIFASQHVRLQNKWLTDVWIYMKNTHPFLGVCTAHRWHPYKKKDRLLVLATTFLLIVFLTGWFATQECCTPAPDAASSTVAVVNNRRMLLESSSSSASSPSFSSSSCLPFHAPCNTTTSQCTLGSTCDAKQATCLPTEPLAAATQCSSAGPGTGHQCPVGWRCETSTNKCRPSTSLVCYLPPTTTATTPTSRGVSFAAEDGETTEEEPTTDQVPTEEDPTTTTPTSSSSIGASTESSGSSSGSSQGSAPVDAISAIAVLLQYAIDHNITTNGTAVIMPSSQPTSSTSASGSGAASSTPVDTAEDRQLLLITLTKPTNGAIYGVSSTIPIAWKVQLLQAKRSFVDALQFQVDFSRDGHTFDIVLASNVTGEVSSGTADKYQYQYDWDLAKNESLACSDCVLRVCTQQESSPSDPVCIRTDGGGSSANTTTTSGEARFTTASAASSTQPKITFRIVREILECSCGLAFASFVTYSYVIALAVPLALLVLEQLVTFYQDTKAFGLFARRGGPQMPVVGFYAAEATKRGRFLLSAIFIALVFGCGMLLARLTSPTFMGSKGEIAVLWVVMFGLVVVIGFIYCSIWYCVLFTVRWYKDEKLLSQQGYGSGGGGAGDFGMFMDDGMMFNNQQYQQQQRNPSEALTYQWPPNHSFPTDSSRSNNGAVVVQANRGMGIV